jgi:hypothetical protein
MQIPKLAGGEPGAPAQHITFIVQVHASLENDAINPATSYPDQLLRITLAPSHGTFGV